jgi:hypothetical protein
MDEGIILFFFYVVFILQSWHRSGGMRDVDDGGVGFLWGAFSTMRFFFFWFCFGFGLFWPFLLFLFFLHELGSSMEVFFLVISPWISRRCWCTDTARVAVQESVGDWYFFESGMSFVVFFFFVFLVVCGGVGWFFSVHFV